VQQQLEGIIRERSKDAALSRKIGKV